MTKDHPFGRLTVRSYTFWRGLAVIASDVAAATLASVKTYTESLHPSAQNTPFGRLTTPLRSGAASLHSGADGNRRPSEANFWIPASFRSFGKKSVLEKKFEEVFLGQNISKIPSG
ncbi:MAG: hypothetical protein ACREUY_05765 [Burkholderiales bacterium]